MARITLGSSHAVVSDFPQIVALSADCVGMDCLRIRMDKYASPALGCFLHPNLSRRLDGETCRQIELQQTPQIEKRKLLGEKRSESCKTRIGESFLMLEFIQDLWAFLKVRKKIWLMPIFVVLALLGGLVVATQQSSLATFIYTLF